MESFSERFFNLVEDVNGCAMVSLPSFNHLGLVSLLHQHFLDVSTGLYTYVIKFIPGYIILRLPAAYTNTYTAYLKV